MNAWATPTPIPTIPAGQVPELVGIPVAVLALIVAGASFLVAMGALAWQIAKHFLDGGRVKVYLNAAIWQPDLMIATNRSGVFLFKDDDAAASATKGRALEVAQLVVENPGRVAVTIYTPGITISGHGKKNHHIGPRKFDVGEGYGPDAATTESLVRLEPYGRVTFLLDYWSVVRSVVDDSPRGRVFLRGQVEVAGRKNRPQKSSWRRRWRIEQGMYTAIEGSPKVSPLHVLWKELFVRFPKDEQEAILDQDDSDMRITRGMMFDLLWEAMSKFDEQPEMDALEEELYACAKAWGGTYPPFGLSLFYGYRELKRLEGNLTEWVCGLRPRATQKEALDSSSQIANVEEDTDGAQSKS